MRYTREYRQVGIEPTGLYLLLLNSNKEVPGNCSWKKSRKENGKKLGWGVSW